MTDRIPYRRHAAQFKLQVCREIRSGALGRRDAQKKYALSDNLIQSWLGQYDRDQLGERLVDESVPITSEQKVAALERKVGQLTMELDQLRRRSGVTPHEPNDADHRPEPKSSSAK
jgi:transposase